MIAKCSKSTMLDGIGSEGPAENGSQMCASDSGATAADMLY